MLRLLLSAMFAANLPAAVLSHTWRGSKLDLTLDDGSALVEWISPTSIRVARQWNATPTNLSKITHDPVLVALEDSPKSFVMKTRYITVEIPKANFGVQVRTGETPIASISVERTQTRFVPMEHVFGLKGNNSPTLDLHGQKIERANGLLLTSGYGVYLPPPQIATYELDKGAIIAANSNAIEFLFYHGATPKEIFEQHLIATGYTEVADDVLASFQIPKEATKLPDAKIDSWEALRSLVRTLNHWSLSAVLYPAFDASSISGPPEVQQRAYDLAALIPLVYYSTPDAHVSFASLRGSLRPYLRTYLREAHDRGFPLIHPLPMQFPKDAGSDQQSDVFLLGDELLVAPVLAPGNRRKLTLPRGLWTDLRTNTEYRGNQTIEIDAPPGRVPMFARNGSVFPLSYVDRMQVHYFPSLGGEFFLWEQDEDDNSQFHAAPAGEYIRVEIESKLNRTYEWVLHHTKAPREVAEEGTTYSRVGAQKDLKPGTWWHDDALNDLHIWLHVDAGSDRIVNITPLPE
jgi:Glycosyl hydrolases family 31